jgi:cytochrome c biogenesis protein CcdA
VAQANGDVYYFAQGQAYNLGLATPFLAAAGCS